MTKTRLANDEHAHALCRVRRHIHVIDLKLQKRVGDEEEEELHKILTKISLGCMESTKEAGEPFRILCIKCWYLKRAEI